MKLTIYDHRVIQAARNLKRSPVQPLPQQAQLRAQGFIQLGLENLQGQRLHNLSGPPDLVPQFSLEKGFPYIQSELLMF